MKFKTSESFYKFLQKILSVFETLFLGALKAYINTQIGQGYLKKSVNWLIENGYQQTLQPIIEVYLIHLGYKHDVKDGKVFVERLKAAEESGNADDWNRTIDDINN